MRSFQACEPINITPEWSRSSSHLSSLSRFLAREPELDTIESDSLFAAFINALAFDAMKHLGRLHEVKEMWDEEWDELLKGVSADED